TAGLWTLFGGVLMVGLTAAGIRTFGTPLWAKLPGLGRLVGLGWDGPIEHRVTLAVNPGKQFVRIHLPPYIIQLLSYYGSVLSVDGPAAAGLRWNHQTDLTSVRLPVRARTLSLLWTDRARDDSWVEITFKAGSRAARLRLGCNPIEQGIES
ncbi:MAG TPA: hypothetical protein VLE27_10020, partial [Thermoanaerobaculia bacterium]|nr:hypothetical protein [Thermoanaerobaculia bacterium]